jgi:hypothetical protein
MLACWKTLRYVSPLGGQVSRGNPSLGLARLAPQATACHASSFPVRTRRRPFCRLHPAGKQQIAVSLRSPRSRHQSRFEAVGEWLNNVHLDVKP